MEYIKFYTTVLRRRPSVGLIPLLTMTVLGLLALCAVGYTRALYYVNKAFLDVEDGVVISSYAISPFTSLVDSREVSKLVAGLDGVNVTYYFITLGYFNGIPAVIKGLNDAIERGCAYVGVELASRLSVIKGDVVAVYSPFTKRTNIFKVCNYTDKPLVLLSYEDAVEVRGVKPGYYSFAVLRASSEEAMDSILRAFGLQPLESSLLSRALIVLTRKEDKIDLDVFKDFAEGYMYRLGLYRDVVFYFAYAVSFAMLVGTPLIGVGLVSSLKGEIRVLGILGLPIERTLAALVLIIASSLVLSHLILAIILKLNLLPTVSILAHSIRPIIEGQDFLAIFSVQFVMSIVGVYYELRVHAE